MGLLIIGAAESRPPKYKCLCCNTAVFYEGEDRAYERHVVACSAKHEEEMREQSPREKTAHFLGRGDTELEGWVRKHRGLILEGRKQM